ncbi:hypothetical protein PTSG_04946 [Salpingoeca rosetta]|uniref:Uncharacterized protein n=1 Tax=Salpingoeca rosetta (strain ATCC 50818 / BSB-021) TaxID=946362 RepID=F2U927_SALR5|nr:uncharacterized protein PTSG_04946 [Salpingoeca rosetta]EGD73230.1 hypothetical protein PTSG_04946 [Salpingoeca rosetta]|eukprot:XP_004994261.1 hypothetical protein PTSG_04946 [Salpingoeca rosetta]
MSANLGGQLVRLRRALDAAQASDGEADLRHEAMSPPIVAWLCQHLVDRQNVHNLWMHHCSLRDAGFETLVRGLGKTGVNHLSLPCNDITDHGLIAVEAWLSRTSEVGELHYLSLRDNRLTSSCAAALGNLVQRLQIRDLSLEDMPSLGDSVAKVLFDLAEQASCKLHNLALHNCGLTDASLRYLQHALQRTRCLQELTLAGNRFSASACKELLLSIPQHTTLRFITLPAFLRNDVQPHVPPHVGVEWIG